MTIETATLAGGCFWCTEAIFQRLKGVHSVLPGYAGGTSVNPTYDEVCSSKTGHAESVQIEFDSSILPYEKILDVFWHTHDPTTLNQQGHDYGTQYRSAIFYHTELQKKIAERSKQNITEEGVYHNPIVTRIVPFTNFYPAEDYHKYYFDRNNTAAYCNFIISPKLHTLFEQYGNDVKSEYIEV